MNVKHVIHRKVFEFDIPDETSYNGFAQRISELQSSKLFEEMGKLFSELIPDDLHIRIDRIEVDVGNIGIDELGDVLIRRILEGLQRQLSSMDKNAALLRSVNQDPKVRDIRLMEYFLEHGRLPWWAPAQGTSIRQVSSRLLHGDLKILRPLFTRHRHDTVRLRRWIGHIDIKDLVPVWKSVHSSWRILSDSDALRLVEASIRLSSPVMGQEASRDAIRYNLLSDLLEVKGRPTGPSPDPRNPLSLLKRATPFSELADLPKRYRKFIEEDPRWQWSRQAATKGSPRDLSPAVGMPASGPMRDIEESHRYSDDIAEFRTFLLSGHLERYRSRSMLTELVRLFRGLVIEQLPALEDAIRDLGRSERVRRRIIDNISSPNIRFFFETAVPGKKNLFDWVSNVYLETQQKMRPINQTNIRVQRSVDEITLEIYTSTDLNAISNEVFLRMHLRRMALKHHIRYEDLLRRIIESVAMPPLPVSSNFIKLLRKIYTEDVVIGSRQTFKPAAAAQTAGEAVLDFFRGMGTDASRSLTALRVHLQQVANTHQLSFSQLLREAAAYIERPPLPVSETFIEQFQKLYVEEAARAGESLPMPASSRIEVVDEVVMEVFRSAGKAAVKGVVSLRKHLQQIAEAHKVTFPELLRRVGALIDKPPLPVSETFIEQFRRLNVKEASRMGEDLPMPTSPKAEASDEAVMAVFRSLGKGAAKDIQSIRSQLRQISDAYGLAYGALLHSLAASVDNPPIQVATRYLQQLRHIIQEDMLLAAERKPMAIDSHIEKAIADLLSESGQAEYTDKEALIGLLRKVAERHRIDVKGLLDRLRETMSAPDTRWPKSFVTAVQAVASDKMTTAAPKPTSGISDEGIRDILRTSPWAGIKDVATLQRQLQQLEGRLIIPYQNLLDRIQSFSIQHPGEVPPTLRHLLAEMRDDRSASYPEENLSDRPGRPPAADEVAERIAGDSSEPPAARPMLDPVPPELLAMLSREVMRALILAKGTGIFGKATRSLQELITAYLRMGKVTPRPEAFDVAEFRRRLSAYLDLEPSFLAFAIRYTALLHSDDGPLQEMALMLSDTGTASVGTDRQPGQGDVLALVEHVAEHRVFYDISHVKTLILPALRGTAVDRELFSAVMRLLFDEDAALVVTTLQRLLDSSRVLTLGRADEGREELYKAFINAALDVRNTPFSLNRVFADVRRRLQPEKDEVFVLPTRLSEVKGHFFKDALQASGKKGRKGVMVRENAIIRLYNILHLDLLLEDAGARFFDNIPFSFELLLTRYRPQLVDILHTKRLDPELAHFFAYSDQSRIFEQIRALYPRARVERVSRIFGHAVDLLHRSRWLTLGRDQAVAFGMLDSFAHIFSKEDTELSVSDIVLDILHRAAEERLLSRAFIDIFRDADDMIVLRRLGRQLGRRRLERLLPSAEDAKVPRSDAFQKRLRLFRDLVPESPREASERDAYLALSAILEAGAFPVGHPFEGQPLESQPQYLAKRVVNGRVLAQLLSDRPPRHAAAVLLSAVERPSLVSAIVQRFGVDRATALRMFGYWSSRVSTEGIDENELMREVLLMRHAREAQRGEDALRKAILTYLTGSGKLHFWDALTLLPQESPGQITEERLLKSLSSAVREVRLGAEPWYEFYFGVMADRSPTHMEDYRAVHVWADYLFRHPAGRTQKRMLSLLLETYMRVKTSQPDVQRLHLGFMEALRPFEGLRSADARRILMELLDAGVSQESLQSYLAARQTRDGIPLASLLQELQSKEQAIFAVGEGGKLRSVPTPKQMLAALSEEGGKGTRVLAGLRAWVEDRQWKEADVVRLVEALPARALHALLRSLAPSSDLLGIVDAWAGWLKASGWQPSSKKSKMTVLGILFSGKLWRYRSPSAIHAAILAASGLPKAVREGAFAPDPSVLARSRIPQALWGYLVGPLKEEELDADEILAGWSAQMLPKEADPSLDDDPLAAGDPTEADVIFYLETGMAPGKGRISKAAPEYREWAKRVNSLGVGRFLSLRRLHASHEESVLEYFEPSSLTEHAFGVLGRQASDTGLRGFLRVLSAEAMRTRVRLSALVRFLRLFRLRTASQAPLGTSGVDRFLEEALRIPGFEALVEKALAAMPAESVRGSRSYFLRRAQRDIRRQAARPRVSSEDALWFFLRTGMLKPSYGIESLEQLTDQVQEAIRNRDPALRSLLFRKSGTEASRRRARLLLSGMEERDWYAFIHPMLFQSLSELARMMRQRFGIDVWRAVGARTDRDRIDRVLLWWSKTRARPDSPMRILRLFMEAATAVLDERQLERIRRPVTDLLTPSEREIWAELRALIPEWIDAPPEEDRKLKKPLEEGEKPAMNDPEPAPDPSEGIPVRNGGLVLLWPYFGRLFSRLQLSDAKNFLGDRELSRAIRITEYIVTGSTEMEEHQLALNKVLCGAPLDFEVPAELDLTPEEADLSQKMLLGAIRNWEKLKTTRPETFRETFLRRDAILYRVENRWELVVQRKAYDMLLDSLPWNISMIQLSWMPDRLVVQWK